MKKIIVIFFISLLIILVPAYIVKNRPKNLPNIDRFTDKSSTPVSTTNPVNNLPKYFLIKTAFIPQAPEKNWDEPWQDACEEAALLTVKYYYLHQSPTTNQIISDLTDLFRIETDLGFSHDINISEMATVSAKVFDLKTKIITDPTVDIMKHYLSQNIPIIIPANGKTLFKENSHFKSGGPWYHNLVILGYDDNRQQFIVHDVGTQFGAYFRYSYNLLIESIHDFPESKNKENINQGAKNILVLVK